MKRLSILLSFLFSIVLCYGQIGPGELKGFFKATDSYILKTQRITDILIDSSLSNNSDSSLSTTKAIKSYIDNRARISITSSDFQSDGVTYLNPHLVSDNTSIFLSDIPGYIYRTNSQWQYVSGGIKILIPGFNANLNSYHLEIDIK